MFQGPDNRRRHQPGQVRTLGLPDSPQCDRILEQGSGICSLGLCPQWPLLHQHHAEKNCRLWRMEEVSFLCHHIEQPEQCIFRYMLRLVDPIYRKLGFTSRPDDTHLDILLRKKAVGYALRPREHLTWDLSFLGELGLLHGKYRLPGECKGEVQRLDGNGSA